MLLDTLTKNTKEKLKINLDSLEDQMSKGFIPKDALYTLLAGMLYDLLSDKNKAFLFFVSQNILAKQKNKRFGIRDAALSVDSFVSKDIKESLTNCLYLVDTVLEEEVSLSFFQRKTEYDKYSQRLTTYWLYLDITNLLEAHDLENEFPIDEYIEVFFTECREETLVCLNGFL